MFPFHLFLFLVILPFFPSSSSYSTTMLPVTAAKDVFILAGQSNMVGLGGMLRNYSRDGVVPPECEPNPRILRLGLDMKWEEAREPLHLLVKTLEPLYGIGPGIPFARSLLQRDPAIGIIGLVPCAVSGSNITNWSRNSSYYTNMVARGRAAVSDGGVLRAFLWYQGESDTTRPSEADAYGRRLQELFVNVRADLQSPSLPIIQVALASGSVYKEKIREAQLHGTELPHVKCVDADGLPLNWDKLHLNTTAQIKLGSMLADAYLNISSGVGVAKHAYMHAYVLLYLCFLVALF